MFNCSWNTRLSISFFETRLLQYKTKFPVEEIYTSCLPNSIILDWLCTYHRFNLILYQEFWLVWNKLLIQDNQNNFLRTLFYNVQLEHFWHKLIESRNLVYRCIRKESQSHLDLNYYQELNITRLTWRFFYVRFSQLFDVDMHDGIWLFEELLVV